jgi:zinc protease
VANSIAELVRFDLPADYFTKYPEAVRALKTEDLCRAVGEVVHPDRLVWVVVGDRATIEPGLRDLGLGQIHVLNADGAEGH